MRDMPKDTAEGSREHRGEKRSVLNVLQSDVKLRQEDASSSKASSSAPDQGLPSERMVKLENGAYVSTSDIECVESFRVLARREMSWLLELKKKCENPACQLSDEASEWLQFWSLINEQGQPSDSVRKIVLDLSERNYLFNPYEPVAIQVKLRNDTEEHYKVVDDVMSKLKRMNPDVLSELDMFCTDPNHALREDTARVLRSERLIDECTGQPSDSVKNIVSCSFDKQSRQLRSPAKRMYELLIKLEKTTQNKTVIGRLKEESILKKMYPHQHRFEPLKPFDHSLDRRLPSELEVRLENGTYAYAMDVQRVQMLQGDGSEPGGQNENAAKAYNDLLEKCKSSTHQHSQGSSKELVRRGLINEQGEPSDLVKNILLSRFEQGEIVTQVKLRNGTEERYQLVDNTMFILMQTKKMKPEAVSELYKLCKNTRHRLENDTAELLISQGLINERTRQPSNSVKNIVLSSFNEKSGKLEALGISYQELEKKIKNNLIHKRVCESLIYRELKKQVDQLIEAGMPKKQAVREKIFQELPDGLIESIEEKARTRVNERWIEHQIERIKQEFPNELEKELSILRSIYLHQERRNIYPYQNRI